MLAKQLDALMTDKIILTEDGSHSIYSEKFGVAYHSKYGAIQETQHVFIDAAFRIKAVIQKDIAILDIGFGTGLNCFMTYLESVKRNLNINYTAVEAYPIAKEQVNELNYIHLLNATDQEKVFFDIHHKKWGKKHQLTEQFSLQKDQLFFKDIEYNNCFDIIYFDAFAPNAQPDLWEEPLLTKMYDALTTDGILVTYCAKGVVKRRLKNVGFEIEALKGPPGKREMTRAIKL